MKNKLNQILWRGVFKVILAFWACCFAVTMVNKFLILTWAQIPAWITIFTIGMAYIIPIIGCTIEDLCKVPDN